MSKGQYKVPIIMGRNEKQSFKLHQESYFKSMADDEEADEAINQYFDLRANSRDESQRFTEDQIDWYHEMLLENNFHQYTELFFKYFHNINEDVDMIMTGETGSDIEEG